jgi:hypothetical protein
VKHFTEYHCYLAAHGGTDPEITLGLSTWLREQRRRFAATLDNPPTMRPIGGYRGVTEAEAYSWFVLELNQRGFLQWLEKEFPSP